MVEEARLQATGSGLAPATDGWFVVNVRDAAWETNNAAGAACSFEGQDAPFAELGVNIGVLRPGRSRFLYHAEPYQEDFLVLAGECLLIVEGEERPLRMWDFVHCPPHTAHAVVAEGDGPCILLMAGARTGDWPYGVVYPRSELALRHEAGVEEETSLVPGAVPPIPPWHPARPEGWDALPWA
jgi:uncharacterized cupin superfamily protein